MTEILATIYRDWLAVTSRFLPPDAAIASVLLVAFVILLWVAEMIDVLAGHRLDRLGIRPRSMSGLFGILFAPLLHGNFGHVAANSVPLLVLGTLVAFADLSNLFVVTMVTWVISGAGVWLFGRANTRHLGASGLIFGYLGFLLAVAVVKQSPLAILLALVAVLLYGGALWGILPLRPGRSWQGHLFGLIGGVLCGWQLDPLRDYFAA